MPMLTKIKCDQITEGVCFSAPVFFEDGVNMFLAANHPARRYHMMALQRWNVPFLITAGQKVQPGTDAMPSSELIDDFDTLEEVEELEVL